jgi:hypothetical protein
MKKLIIISSTILTIASGTSYALTRPAEIGADEKPPIVLQVENHEERIVDLEDKTDKTKTQVNQNSQDIGALQSGTNIEPTETVPEVKTPTKKPTTPIVIPSQPTPEPVIDPNTIIRVEITEKSTGWYCNYFVHNGKRIGVNHGKTVPCYEVGTVLPRWLWPR